MKSVAWLRRTVEMNMDGSSVSIVGGLITMPDVLTVNQAAQYLTQAGFSGDDLIITMICIGMAESGLNPNAHNTNGEDSRGWLQINIGPGANTDLAGYNLFDPLQNAEAAMIIYKRQTLSAWSTYTNGSYRQYWNQVAAEYQKQGSGNGNLESRLTTIEQWIRSFHG